MSRQPPSIARAPSRPPFPAQHLATDLVATGLHADNPVPRSAVCSEHAAALPHATAVRTAASEHNKHGECRRRTLPLRHPTCAGSTPEHQADANKVPPADHLTSTWLAEHSKREYTSSPQRVTSQVGMRRPGRRARSAAKQTLAAAQQQTEDVAATRPPLNTPPATQPNQRARRHPT